MKIFGIEFETKRDLRKHNTELMIEIEELLDELRDLEDMFPFDLGQVVYDVALKNAQGRYTKTKPAREYSTITEVEVNEKNYFNLKKRFENNDVFFSYEDAESYLDHVCK
jgi:hypothetical protein